MVKRLLSEFRIEMPNYRVKNVEPIVVSDNVQARVFTLAHGDVIPCTITARVRIIISRCGVPSRSIRALRTIDECSVSVRDTQSCRARPTAFRMNRSLIASSCLFKGWASTTGTRPM